MSENVVSSAIKFEQYQPNHIPSERLKFLQEVSLHKDETELISVCKIGKEENEGVVLAGLDNKQIFHAILISFVKKLDTIALQIITMSPHFKPDDQLIFGLTLSNKQQYVFHFAQPAIPVEGTAYAANFIPFSSQQVIDFISNDIIHWQLYHQETKALLTSVMDIEAQALLPPHEAQYLLRKILCEVVKY